MPPRLVENDELGIEASARAISEQALVACRPRPRRLAKPWKADELSRSGPPRRALAALRGWNMEPMIHGESGNGACRASPSWQRGETGGWTGHCSGYAEAHDGMLLPMMDCTDRIVMPRPKRCFVIG